MESIKLRNGAIFELAGPIFAVTANELGADRDVLTIRLTNVNMTIEELAEMFRTEAFTREITVTQTGLTPVFDDKGLPVTDANGQWMQTAIETTSVLVDYSHLLFAGYEKTISNPGTSRTAPAYTEAITVKLGQRTYTEYLADQLSLLGGK